MTELAVEAMKAGAQDYLVEGRDHAVVDRADRALRGRAQAREENTRRLAKSDEAALRARFVSAA